MHSYMHMQTNTKYLLLKVSGELDLVKGRRNAVRQHCGGGGILNVVSLLLEPQSYKLLGHLAPPEHQLQGLLAVQVARADRHRRTRLQDALLAPPIVPINKQFIVRYSLFEGKPCLHYQYSQRLSGPNVSVGVHRGVLAPSRNSRLGHSERGHAGIHHLLGLAELVAAR